MSLRLLLLSLLAAQDAAAPPRDSAIGLSAIPNTTIRYYDVAGKDVTSINRAIARQRPRSPSGKPMPASTDWSVTADFERRTEGGSCRVTGASARFTATAVLPRLIGIESLDRPLQERWRNYVEQLEHMSAATLVFVHQNLGSVEKAISGSSCEEARNVATAAVARLRHHAALLEAERERRLARANQSLTEFRPNPSQAQLKICKDLSATGSRLRTFRVCMPQREWDRMNADGEQFTREVQNKSINGKYF